MKKLLAAAALLFAHQASALPSYGDISGVPALNGFQDTGYELFEITDTSGFGIDDTDMLITLRNAGGQNKVFIYDDQNPTLQLTVFEFTDPVFSAATLSYDIIQNKMSLAGNELQLSGNGVFGMGIEHSDGNKYYSQAALNADGFDHLLTFDISNTNQGGIFSLGNIAFAWEDLPNGGDQDFNDVVYIATDLQSVPAPGVMALFGIGLLAMAKVWKTREES